MLISLFLVISSVSCLQTKFSCNAQHFSLHNMCTVKLALPQKTPVINVFYHLIMENMRFNSVRVMQLLNSNNNVYLNMIRVHDKTWYMD